MRARGNGRMAVLKLCDQVGRGARRRGRGGRRASGARPGLFTRSLGACTACCGARLPRSLRPGPSQVRVRGRRGSAGCGSGRRARGARVAAAPGEGSLGLRCALRSSQPRGAGAGVGEGCPRGQEEEGGRRERRSQPRCPGPLPHQARGWPGSPLRCNRLSSSVG